MSQKKATIVNLAASNVSVSQFSVEAGSLVLEQFFVEDIAPGLTGDDEWLNAAVAALASLVNAHELKGRVTVIAPAFLLLQKPLKVPQVERARQAQIVAFEAQNAIPYPLNEVIWDSQLMASDGVEAEVLLFALRTEVATKIANMVTSTGLRPMSIQAAPLLDSQAFRLAGGSAAEEVLIINVGARSTTLSFVGPSGVNIQSATNIGGNLLTQGVSDNTGQPFAVSEAIKVGYFPASSSWPSPTRRSPSCRPTRRPSSAASLRILIVVSLMFAVVPTGVSPPASSSPVADPKSLAFPSNSVRRCVSRSRSSTLPPSSRPVPVSTRSSSSAPSTRSRKSSVKPLASPCLSRLAST